VTAVVLGLVVPAVPGFKGDAGVLPDETLFVGDDVGFKPVFLTGDWGVLPAAVLAGDWGLPGRRLFPLSGFVRAVVPVLAFGAVNWLSAFFGVRPFYPELI